MVGSPTPAEPQLRSQVDAGDGGQLLADAMSLNVILSAVSGLILLFGSSTLHGPFGVDAWILTVLGGGLVLFASLLLWLLAQPQQLTTGARLVIAADVAWIVGAVLLLLAYPTAVAPAGAVALATVTVAVAGLVVAQSLGLRRAGAAPVTGAIPIGLRFERLVAAPVDEVWRTVSDAGDYARFAPGISATEIVAGSGNGMVRVCTDDRGGRWAEHCTLWDEGRRYRMTVDVGSYPWYYRMLLQAFAQEWALEPASGGTHLTLSFDGAVKLGVFGRLATRVLASTRRLEAIVEAYEHELTAGPRTADGPPEVARQRDAK